MQFLRVKKASSSGEWSGEKADLSISSLTDSTVLTSLLWICFQVCSQVPLGIPPLLALGQAFQIHHEVTQQDKSSPRLTGFRLLDGLGPDVVAVLQVLCAKHHVSRCSASDTSHSSSTGNIPV